jgi:hypothetical protein
VLWHTKITAFPLWGPFYGIVLFLLHEDNFANQDHNYKFRKALIFLAHPQRMFYQSIKSRESISQDLALRAALLMARVDLNQDINYDPEYYQSHRFLSKVPSIAKVVVNRAMELQKAKSAPTPKRRNMEVPPRLQTDVAESDSNSNWDNFFTIPAHSNTISCQLLPIAMSTLKGKSDSIQHPLELPQEAQDWFRGTRLIFFKDQPIHGITEVQLAVCQATGNSSSKTEQLGLVSLLKILMSTQDTFFQATRKKLFPVDDQLYNRLTGEIIQTTCLCGALEANDSHPRYNIIRPEEYVMRLSSKPRKSLICGNARKYMKPVSAEIPSVASDIASLRTNKLKSLDRQQYASLLRPLNESDRLGLPAIIECWCIICKDKTRVKGLNSSFIDTNPRWTLGIVRPLYVERKPQCETHENHTSKGSSPRFIPKSLDISSITSRRLAVFSTLFQNEGVDDVVKACLLDNWPESSRYSRKEQSVLNKFAKRTRRST